MENFSKNTGSLRRYEFGAHTRIAPLTTMKPPGPFIPHCVFSILMLLFPFTTISQTFPPGFTPVQVVTGMAKPAAMTFTPDGRILVTEQGGTVRVIKDGTLLPDPMIKLQVNSRGEGGLVGITVDPDFITNQYIYLYYTLPNGSHNRISRFTCNGNVAATSSEKIILELDPRTASIHNGGAMRFKEGKLYVSIGDNATGANAQNLDTYHGKVIRINPDGTAPADNPYPSGSEQRRRVWSYGLRNPFTFDIQPGTGTIFVNDVGLEKWEEINDATLPGKNYGWPLAEGNSTNPAFTNAVYAYAHGRNDAFGCAITGGTFFNPVQSDYPSVYTGRYFFQDYCSQWIRMLVFSGASVTVENFATDIGEDALYLSTGIDGNLYYLVRSTGSLYKVIYSSGDAPAILKHPEPVSVSLGQPASFSVTASGKAPLTYQWQKNGADISGASMATFTIVQATASDTGNYRVRVSNTSGSVVSNTARLTVTSNRLPVAQIITPAAGTLYRAGDEIMFSGDATDAEDGILPASRFTWFADFHHDTHRHDGPPVASGTRSGSFTVPVRGETSDNVWYRLYLVVTDSQGASDTAYRDIHPRKSTFTLVSQPEGLQVSLDGLPVNTPLAVVGVERLERTIGVVTPQVVDGKTYIFSAWLHGGAESQVISTPLEDTSYTAVYEEEVTGGDTVVTGLAPDPQEIKNNGVVSLFPNPAKEGTATLTISYEGAPGQAGKAIVYIVNVTGQVIFSKIITCEDNCKRISVDLGRRLPSGVYAINAVIAQKQFTRRWLVR
ncbi:PQQ-dependent sugar dehydrogenase [Fulvivirgaceae bacterium PWU4]|uniref:PQQ-dependent sugar dehydrogenase n=1 Tax=Chryseosolibacter histidini TaxID=2782349 RepID=A0AAP2DPU3_9BACT|nr:PQQ-dependent sugar dehydrogenase [Chryseosolibacter histidini]MBT1699017.1 PQQ-dependent sugar dehydrogenase [Chryseosolibacter histidini]